MNARVSSPALLPLFIALLGSVTGCGGATPPVPVTGAPSDDAGAALAPEPAPTMSPPAASATMPSAPADAGPPAPRPIGESADECTPVGVDFEKRARPKLKECYAEGKKKNPNLEGTVKIKMTVDLKGKIKSVKVIEKTLPDPVAECMLKVVKATPFPEVEKCWDSTLTIPLMFPTPH